MSRTPDRRHKRSSEIFQALGYQLKTCREDGKLHGLVLSDEDGLCLAAAGPADTCGEVAATLPLLGRKAGDFKGVLLGDQGGVSAMVQRFRVDDAELYMCALGGDEDRQTRQIARSINGCARILASG